MPEEELPERVHLTRVQFNAIREAVLEGLKVSASKSPVDGMQFKAIRDAWSLLAPVQGAKRIVIEIDNE